MQNLSVISVNIWEILIALLNLLLLTWVLKKFLFKPVMKVLDERRAKIDGDYLEAEQANEKAQEARSNYEAALEGAHQEAESILNDATRRAEHRGNEIVQDAREKASDIRKQAEADALLEKKKAEEDIRKEIADVSTRLTGKLLEREITEEDHRVLIDSFLQEIGTNHDTDE